MQVLIEIENKFVNIDHEELLIWLQAKILNDKCMIDLDVDDLYGKSLSAVKKRWEQKYVMSEEEILAFAKQWTYKQSTPSSQHKTQDILNFHLPNRNMN